MPMRLGEMVLIIRTQDYASRNLNRLSQNLGKLSKAQQLQRRMQMQGIQADRLIGRQTSLQKDIGMLKQRLQVESSLLQVAHQRSGAASRLAALERGAAQTARGIRAGTVAPGGVSTAPQIAGARSVLANLRAEEMSLQKTHADLLHQLSLTNPALAKMSTAKTVQEMARLEKELDLTSRRLRTIHSDMGITQQAINKLKWDKVHQFGQGMSRAGRVLQLAGLIGVGSLAAMGNAAASFGQMVTLAATQTRDVGAGIGQVATRSTQLQKDILDQMMRFPATGEEMADAAYQIFSSLDLAKDGAFDYERGVRLLNTANKVAVAGGVSLSESIKGLIILFNNFDPQLKNTTGTLDTMFDIVRFGNLTVADFTQLITRVAATAKGVGHTLDDLAAPIAFLTRVLPSERVGTGLFRLEEMFANRDFREGFKLLSQERIGKTLDLGRPAKDGERLLQMLEDVARVFPELTTGGADVADVLKMISGAGKTARTGKPSEGQLFTSQARNVLRPLLQNLQQVREIQGLIIGNRGEFEASFKAMADTDPVKWKVFLNTLKVLALEIGSAVLPALLGLTGWIRGAIQWWRNLDDHTKKLIVKFTLWASVAALLGGIAFSVVGGLIAIVGAIALMSGGLGAAGGAGLLGRLATMFTLLRALTLIGVITITIKLVLDKTGISNWIESTMDKLEGMSGTFPKPLKGLVAGLNRIDEAFGLADKRSEEGFFNPDAKLFPDGILPSTKKAWKNLKDVTNDGTIDINDIIKKAGQMTKREFKDIYGKTLDELRQKFSNTGEDASQMGEAVSSAMDQARQSVDQAAANLTNTFLQFKEQNTAAFGEMFSGPFFQSETWSLAEEWDVKPAMKDINNDLRQQIKAFKDWRSTLRGIGKRKGATPELMKELSALGPGAMKFLEVLRKGSPGAWNQFIGLWRQKQKVIENATKIDFQKQLDQWFKYGKGIAQQIILGLRSENVALDNAMKKYITSKFPNIVAEAGAAAAKEYRRQNPKAPTTTTTPKAQQQPAVTQTDSNNQTTIIVHPASGETTLHALKRGAWEYKNGGGHRGRTTPPKNAKVFVDPYGPHGPNYNNPYLGPRK